MSQKKQIITLATLIPSGTAYGSDLGRAVLIKLIPLVEAAPVGAVVAISLNGISAMDTTFAREAILRLVKMFSKSRWICVTDIADRDLLDNLAYSAESNEAPLTVCVEGEWKIVGVKLSSTAEKLIELILTEGRVSTARAAEKLGISIPNASTTMKRFYEQGLFFRCEEIAETGGIEYRYQAIRP